MLAVALIAGVGALGVSVAVMTSEKTETDKTKADIKYLKSKEDYDFSNTREANEKFKVLKDTQLINALKNPLVDYRFIDKLSEDQIKNLVRQRDAADAILAMQQNSRLTLCQKVLTVLKGVWDNIDTKVAAVLLIANQVRRDELSKITYARLDDVGTELIEIYKTTADNNVRIIAGSEIEELLKMDKAIEQFYRYGDPVLPFIGHEALAHVIHKYESTADINNKLARLQEIRNLTKEELAVIEKRVGSSGNLKTFLQRVIADNPHLGTKPNVALSVTFNTRVESEKTVPVNQRYEATLTDAVKVFIYIDAEPTQLRLGLTERTQVAAKAAHAFNLNLSDIIDVAVQFATRYDVNVSLTTGALVSLKRAGKSSKDAIADAFAFCYYVLYRSVQTITETEFLDEIRTQRILFLSKGSWNAYMGTITHDSSYQDLIDTWPRAIDNAREQYNLAKNMLKIPLKVMTDGPFATLTQTELLITLT